MQAGVIMHAWGQAKAFQWRLQRPRRGGALLDHEPHAWAHDVVLEGILTVDAAAKSNTTACQDEDGGAWPILRTTSAKSGSA